MQLSDLDLIRAAAGCRTLADAKRRQGQRDVNPTARALANLEAVALEELAARFEEEETKGNPR